LVRRALERMRWGAAGMGDEEGTAARVSAKDCHSLAGVKWKPRSAAKTESIGDGKKET